MDRPPDRRSWTIEGELSARLEETVGYLSAAADWSDAQAATRTLAAEYI